MVKVKIKYQMCKFETFSQDNFKNYIPAHLTNTASSQGLYFPKNIAIKA